MKKLIPLIYLSLVLASCQMTSEKKVSHAQEQVETVRLCAENPRYLEYKGDALVLITSAEHYGAVLNKAFDYKLYLESLALEGFNYTRIFTGSYLEPVDNIFNIRNNTLAPEEGQYLSPWLMEEGKYDLERFNPAYFVRLKDFMTVAASLDIIVELTLFSSIYDESAWILCPFYHENNMNGVGELPYVQTNTLQNGGLLKYQEMFVREVVRQLNGFDNFFFEIQNEPWSDNGELSDRVNEGDEEVFTQPWQKEIVIANEASMRWQERMAEIIQEEEKALPKKHLIAQNICNFQYELEKLPDHVSVINFHYALPPAVQLNLGLGGMIGLDETGFMPQEDSLYLDQAWRFILSGGGLYNNLDYSFTTGYEQGDREILPTNPGWGGPVFRKKLGYLNELIHEIPFPEMHFSDSVFKARGGMKQYGLVKEGELCLVFLEGLEGETLETLLPEGSYEFTFMDVDSGQRTVEKLEISEESKVNAVFGSSRGAVKIKKLD